LFEKNSVYAMCVASFAAKLRYESLPLVIASAERSTGDPYASFVKFNSYAYGRCQSASVVVVLFGANSARITDGCQAGMPMKPPVEPVCGSNNPNVELDEPEA
jgi:hypothetical protein